MIDPYAMSVLIVDDMENMCKSIRGMLKILRFGKTFRYATNGHEALNMLKKFETGLAIVDWNMPLMTGVELLGHIRADKALRDMPVVMVTAEANREIVAEAAESDIDAYILKPLTVKSLGERISSVIERANNPPPMFRHLKTARDLEEKGDIDAAIEEAKLAMEADPESSKPLREIGHYYFKKNDLKTAEEWLLKAAKMNKLDVFAFHHLGELYIKQNDIERAAKYFDKAMSISPRHVSRGVYFGKVLVQKNMIKKAKKVFDKALELSDDTLSLQEEIANFCLEKGLHDYGAKLMESVLQSVPDRPDLMLKLGKAHENLGDYRKALTYLTDAEHKGLTDLDVKVHIAKNHIALGQVLRAEQELNFVLMKEPNHPTARELLKLCL